MKNLLCAAALLLLRAGPVHAGAPDPAAPSVLPGVDVLLSERPGLLRGKRVGLITHAAAVTSRLKSTADALFESPDVRLVALMGPEHGIRGAAYAGEKVSDQVDPKTRLPLFSLYGKTPKPTARMLSGVDVLVYDLQDIGSRSYTYIGTLALAMEAAAEAGIPLVVLDRPDPLGGLRVEGNIPPAGWKRSLVCALPIPYVYGMTPGELARMIDGEGWLPGGKRCDLTVVPLKGWKRAMLFPETGLPWVPTSPHIPHAETSFFYPATGLLPSDLSNGVGYTLPFELVGAPWIDGERLAEKLNALALPGLAFRPAAFKPFYATFKDQACQGVQIHILDAAKAPLLPVGLYALDALRELYPERRVYEDAPSAPKGVWDEWESVLADPGIRRQLAAGRPAREVLADWQRQDAEFLKLREKYLLYR